MITLSTVFNTSELRDPPTQEALAKVELALGAPLPDQLRSLYGQTNGICGDWTVTIFEVEAIVERNETYEVPRYLPDFIYIGNDNGNRGLFISRTSSLLTLFETDLGDQSIESLVALAPSLSDWFERSCPWSDGEPGIQVESR
jgi:hypothetical protein